MKKRVIFKILPLSFSFSCEKEFWEECVKEKDRINPTFNKNGYYLDRINNITWLEINGEAWIYGNREYFEYSMFMDDGNNWMENNVFEALKVVIDNRFGDKKLKDLYRLHWEKRAIRKTYRDAKLECQKSLGSFRKKLNENRKAKTTNSL